MKKLSLFLNFLIISLCLVIGGAFYYLKSKTQPIEARPKLSQKQMDELVNRHLHKTLSENRLSRALNEKTISDAKDNLAEQARLKRIKEDKENAKIPLEQQIWKEDKLTDVPSPTDEVNEYLVQNQMIEDEKKEYARQWIQNARKNGYLLELSPDLEVIKYVPIRKPSQQDDSVESSPSD